MLIPTRRKPRIGADLAYPIGAERLSTAIGDLPQAAEMMIYFAAPSRFSQAVWRFSGAPYQVLALNYRTINQGLSQPRGWSDYGPPGSTPWLARIAAVPKEEVSVIRVLLADELLKTGRPWLASQDTADHREGRAGFALSYDPSTKELIVSAHTELLPRTAKR
jgi:hypothetical protein